MFYSLSLSQPYCISIGKSSSLSFYKEISLQSVGLRVYCLWFSFIDPYSFSQSLQGQWWPDEA